MNTLHRRLASLALGEIGRYGFCLAGGYAVQEHGFLDRPSEDVDIFTTADTEDRFPNALTAVRKAFENDGLAVSITFSAAGFARLQVTDPSTGAAAKVELGVDWRAHPPVELAIGPDCTATTPLRTRSALCTPERRHGTTWTSTRSVARAITTTRNSSPSRGTTTPGSTRPCSSWRFRAIHRLPTLEFTAYGLTTDDALALRERMTDWADAIEAQI